MVGVVLRLLRELVELVDDPHPALTGYTRTAGQSDRSPAAELARLAAWMEQPFDVRDSRAVLRPHVQHQAIHQENASHGRPEMRRTLDDATAEELTWDSRGARVAYHSRRDGQWPIWITAPPLSSDPTP